MAVRIDRALLASEAKITDGHSLADSFPKVNRSLATSSSWKWELTHRATSPTGRPVAGRQTAYYPGPGTGLGREAMEATRRPVEGAAEDGADISDDVRLLHSLGYAQELRRRMSLFSNFAISFSIICILAGGVTSFQLGFAAAGGASIGIGWPLACLFSLIVACSMGQIASAYPTAGGLYHWASILGGRGWGWATAWINLLGLVFVVASVNVGVYTLALNLLGPLVGLDPSAYGVGTQIVAVILITASQALFNHLGIRVTTLLTDFSGYLIFAVAIVLTAALLASAPSLDFSRLVTFANFTGTNFPGDAASAVWPNAVPLWVAFALGLLLPAYTITGFDASAHTSEETVNAQRSVPRGMINAVVWSAVFGYVMVCSFVLAMPNTTEGAKQGANVFFWVMDQSSMAKGLKDLLYVGVVLSNYLCALAGMTSFSRMVFAFARDGGLPFSQALRRVSPTYRTPVNAIWASALLAVAGHALYAGLRHAGGRLRRVPLPLLRHAGRRRPPRRGPDLDALRALPPRRPVEALRR